MNTDSRSRRNWRIWLVFLTFLMVVALCFIYVHVVAPAADMDKGNFYQLLKSTIPNWITSLIAISVLYATYLFKLSPEYELREAFTDEIRIREIREGIARIVINLQDRQNKFVPDVILCMTRSGAILANMIATQKIDGIKNTKIIYVPRVPSEPKDGKYRYGVLFPESILEKCSEWGQIKKDLREEFLKNNKKILVVTMLADTMSSFWGLVKYFEKALGVHLLTEQQDSKISGQNDDIELRVVSVYKTPAGERNYKNAKINLYSAFEADAAAANKLLILPWILDKYNFI